VINRVFIAGIALVHPAASWTYHSDSLSVKLSVSRCSPDGSIHLTSHLQRNDAASSAPLLLLKSLRVSRVFMQQKAMKRSKVTLRMIVEVSLTFYSVDGMILVWCKVDFSAPATTTVAAREFPGEVDQISCHSSSFIFSVLTQFWNIVLVFSGLHLSFLIRKVSVDFQESIWIFSSVVVVLFACLGIQSLAYAVDLSAMAFFASLSGTLLLCTAITIALMIVPKLLRLHDSEMSSRPSCTIPSEPMSAEGKVHLNQGPPRAIVQMIQGPQEWFTRNQH
jgi:gamma-aminobutyric acid type B receptor